MAGPTYPRILYQPDATHSQTYLPETPEPPDPVPPDESEAGLCIDIMGTAYGFDPSQGEELDPYHDPMGQFVQRNILCRNEALPDLLVWYRPDLGSDREEWVVEWGDAMQSLATDLTAYAMTITCANGDEVGHDLPGHWTLSRWRWQSSPRPVRTIYGQLVAQNLLPALDPSDLADGPILTVDDYEPMANYCGLPQNQGQTGGYPGIGPITGWQAQYLARGASEHALRQQAEVSGTYQWHVRDHATLAPLDIVNDYPRASFYGDKGDPRLYRTSVNQPDAGHYPSISYVPYLLTGDPYYLEEMQFSTNHMMLMSPPDSRFYFAGRYIAWPLRGLTEIALAMGDHVFPSWLLPRSYWEHWITYIRNELQKRMDDGADPFYYLFHTIPEWGQTTTLDPNKTGDHVWQHSMLAYEACWLAQHREDWVAAAEWLIHSEVDRTSPTSGWARSHPAPYHLRMRCASVLGSSMTETYTALYLSYEDTFMSGEIVTIDSEQVRLDMSSDYLKWGVTRAMNGTQAKAHNANAVVYGRKFTSWCEAKASNALVYGWTDTDTDQMPEVFDATYPSYVRAALAMAMHAGLTVPGITEGYEWIDAEIRERGSSVGDNWCTIPNLPTRRRRRRPDLDPGENPYPPQQSP